MICNVIIHSNPGKKNIQTIYDFIWHKNTHTVHI